MALSASKQTHVSSSPVERRRPTDRGQRRLTIRLSVRARSREGAKMGRPRRGSQRAEKLVRLRPEACERNEGS
jgi:hypothetical protein